MEDTGNNFISIPAPVLKGVNTRSKHNIILKVDKVHAMSKRIPIVDLISRIVLVINPAFVGAWTYIDAVTVWTYLLYRMYSILKYDVYFGNWFWSTLLALSTMSTKNRKSDLRTV